MTKLVVGTFVSAVALLAYTPVVLQHADFVFDDRRGIVINPDLRPEVSGSDLWYHDYWGAPLHRPASHRSWRPLTVQTFRANYALHQLDARLFRATNALLHCASCALMFVVTQPMSRSASEHTTASLLFAVHPVHTEAMKHGA